MRNYLIFLLTFVTVAGCNKSQNNPQPDGPLTLEEVRTLPEMSLEQIENAYNYVTLKNPALLQDSLVLSRAVFNRLKTNPNGRLAASSIILKQDCIPSVFTAKTHLSAEEVLHILTYVESIPYLIVAVVKAGNSAESEFPCDADVGYRDGKADAVRHAFWNALMVKYISLEYAEEQSTLHEHGCLKSDNVMDIHNNKVGRDLAVEYPTATAEQLLELIVQKRFVYVESSTTLYPPEAKNSLIYINAKRPYDGTLRGYLTNPDADKVWNATFDINQCGKIIRGQYTVVSGQFSQKRRFSGVLDQNGSISLDVAIPYVFEDPSGSGYCYGVNVTLTGNENLLAGRWTSTSCKLGGEIKVSR